MEDMQKELNINYIKCHDFYYGLYKIKRWNSFHKSEISIENNVCECHFNGNTPMCGFDGFECEPSLGWFSL